MPLSRTARFAYPANLAPQPDGSVLVRFPDFPEAITDGDDDDDARAEAADALTEALAQRIILGGDIPAPSPARGRALIAPTALIAAKAGLYYAVREAGINASELARRMNVAETEARRLLNPRHATKIDRMEAALALFGKKIEITIRAAA